MREETHPVGGVAVPPVVPGLTGGLLVLLWALLGPAALVPVAAVLAGIAALTAAKARRRRTVRRRGA
jgi:hypothetical protein